MYDVCVTVITVPVDLLDRFKLFSGTTTTTTSQIYHLHRTSMIRLCASSMKNQDQSAVVSRAAAAAAASIQPYVRDTYVKINVLLVCPSHTLASRATSFHFLRNQARNDEICRYRRRSGFRPGGNAVIGIQPFVSPAHTSRGADRIVLRTHPKCLNAHEKTCRQKQQQQQHQASDGRCGRRRGARGIRRRRNSHCFAGDFQSYQGQ